MSHYLDPNHPDLGWQPAIPLPLYGGWLWRRWFGCHCKQQFRTEFDYQEHYARSHFVDDSGITEDTPK